MENIINNAWEEREGISPQTGGEIRDAVEETLAALDGGRVRVAERGDNGWKVNDWAKKAILLSMRMTDMQLMDGTAGGSWYDKVPSKFAGWDEARFKQTGFRAVPGSFVRYGAYVAPGAVLMPCFVNFGAYVGEGSMIDSWATVGSCAQIGRDSHISGGAGIGGVLEPLQASPVIIEDNCFIGARSEVAEGVIVEEGAVLAMGVYIGASTKIIDRETGDVYMGRVPAYSVVVPGSLPPKRAGDPSLYAAVIVKKVDAQTRSKTSINELLR